MLSIDFRSLNWPRGPVDSAAKFYAECLPTVRRIMHNENNPDVQDGVAIILPKKGHEHRAWRLAAIQELAREAAPRRVNGVVGQGNRAVKEVVEWLETAPGITGQLLDLAPG